MNIRSYALTAALAFCALLLSVLFIILAIGLMENVGRDYVAAAPFMATMPTRPTAAVLEPEPSAGGYAQAIIDYNRILAIALNAMNDLVASTVIDTNAWAPRLNTSQVVLLYAQADLQQATPPADLLQVHNDLLASAAQCIDVIDRAARSLNAHDLAALQQLSEPLRTCHASFNQANTAARQLNPRLASLPGVSAPQPAAVQRAAAVPPPQPPAPVAPAAIFQSGGLGQDKSFWEANHGPSTKNAGFVQYEGFNTLSSGDNISLVWARWSTAVSAEEAQSAGIALMPKDGKLVETYSPPGRPKTTVHLYYSSALASRFEAQVFIGGRPGDYTIQYNVFDDKVSSVVIAIGNNP